MGGAGVFCRKKVFRASLRECCSNQEQDIFNELKACTWLFDNSSRENAADLRFEHIADTASALGPICQPSALCPLEFLRAGFNFVPVCIIKFSCAALVKHNCEFSIHKF